MLDREVIFEAQRLGGVCRMAAIDVETGIEVVIQAPASVSDADAQAVALAKLKRALGLTQSASQTSEPPSAPPKPRGAGVWV